MCCAISPGSNATKSVQRGCASLELDSACLRNVFELGFGNWQLQAVSLVCALFLLDSTCSKVRQSSPLTMTVLSRKLVLLTRRCRHHDSCGDCELVILLYFAFTLSLCVGLFVETRVIWRKQPRSTTTTLSLITHTYIHNYTYIYIYYSRLDYIMCTYSERCERSMSKLDFVDHLAERWLPLAPELSQCFAL